MGALIVPTVSLRGAICFANRDRVLSSGGVSESAFLNGFTLHFERVRPEAEACFGEWIFVRAHHPSTRYGGPSSVTEY